MGYMNVGIMPAKIAEIKKPAQGRFEGRRAGQRALCARRRSG
jgi:hypothetical protein